MHGHEFSPLLKDPDRESWDHGALLALTGMRWGNSTRRKPKILRQVQGVPWWVSYSKGQFKYIRTLERGEIEEFYDLEKDPEELKNLALNPEYHELISGFRKKTVAELERTNAPYAKRLPSVFPLDPQVRERYQKILPELAEEENQEEDLEEGIRDLLPLLFPEYRNFDI